MSEFIYGSIKCERIPEFKLERREEIVRCRDCEHFNRMNDDEGMCMVPDGDGDYKRWMVDGDGFCYEGERRDA